MKETELLKAIEAIPVIDVHTHMRANAIAAPSLEQVLTYHMLIYPARSAGVEIQPVAKTDPPATSEQRMANLLKAWPAIETTAFGGVLKRILRDLYGVERLDGESLGRLEAAFRERSARGAWGPEVLRKAGVVRMFSNMSEIPVTQDYDGFRFSVEKQPEAGFREPIDWRGRLERMGQAGGRTIAGQDDLYAATAAYFAKVDWSGDKPFVAWLSCQADFSPAPPAEVDRLIQRAASGQWLWPHESRALEAAYIRSLCAAVRKHTRIVQIAYGIQMTLPPPMRPVVRSAGEFATSFCFLANEFPDLHFNLLGSVENDEPTLCSLCTAFGNVSLAGFWFHGFYPSAMERAWHRRLEMVPASRLIGFFSDGYCAEWIYGKLQTVRGVLAQVLTERVHCGTCTSEQAVATARELFYETPKKIFLPKE